MTTVKSIGALRISATWALCLAICGPAPSQEISHPYPKSPREVVFDLFKYYDIVVDGEFYSLPEYSEAELRSLKREDVVIQFRIRKRYKGPVRDSFKVRLPNEMLVFPGEGISRFEKKHQVLDKQDEDLKPIRQEYRVLLASYEAGETDEAAYRVRAREIGNLIQQRIESDGLADLARRFVDVDHGKTFYDLNGFIRPGERYLIAFDNNPDGSKDCVLDPFFKFGKLYWGERRAYVLPAFETLILIPPGEGQAGIAPQARASPRPQP